MTWNPVTQWFAVVQSGVATDPASREQRNPTLAPGTSFLRLSPVSPNQILRLQIRAGSPDAVQILAYLKAFATHYGRSPYIREFVRSILPQFTANNDQAIILRTIVAFVRDRMIYLPDPDGAEYVIDPIALLELIRASGRAYGDCDDHVLLLNSMANAVGFETRVVGVKLHSADRWDHVIASVKYRGDWVDIDPCLKSNEAPDYREKLVT